MYVENIMIIIIFRENIKSWFISKLGCSLVNRPSVTCIALLPTNMTTDYDLHI